VGQNIGLILHGEMIILAGMSIFLLAELLSVLYLLFDLLLLTLQIPVIIIAILFSLYGAIVVLSGAYSGSYYYPKKAIGIGVLMAFSGVILWHLGNLFFIFTAILFGFGHLALGSLLCLLSWTDVLSKSSHFVLAQFLSKPKKWTNSNQLKKQLILLHIIEPFNGIFRGFTSKK
jgi:hypothetical protein